MNFWEESLTFWKFTKLMLSFLKLCKISWISGKHPEPKRSCLNLLKVSYTVVKFFEYHSWTSRHKPLLLGGSWTSCVLLTFKKYLKIFISFLDFWEVPWIAKFLNFWNESWTFRKLTEIKLSSLIFWEVPGFFGMFPKYQEEFQNFWKVAWFPKKNPENLIGSPSF